MLKVFNPATSELIWEVPSLTGDEAQQQVAKAVAQAPAWAQTPIASRAALLIKVAGALRAQKASLATLMAQEMGKPLHEGLAEVEKAAWCAEHYAEHAPAYLAKEVIASDASESYVQFEPLGTILGILPWNAPVWIAFRFLAPALMAGNTCVMKHDPHVPKSAAAILAAFEEAGADEGLVVNLPVETAEVAALIEHPNIAAVSFTGSSAAGAKVASLAAAHWKPAVLELGGSDPFVVLADADLDAAADVAVLSRIINAGQSCIAAKRVIVESRVYDAFIALVKSRLAALKVGDPMSADTKVGPLAREDLREQLNRQVQTTITQGAKCLLGGELSSGAGWYYPVTLLVDVTTDMCAAQEETFGPVMVVMKADDEEHALAIANHTQYGLGAAVWTQSVDRANRFIHALNAGQVSVNGIVKTDPRLPSGGIKRSGYGRELGPHGIKEFVNAKQVWVK